ncbi:unnamed protein product [Bursaphelenchus xylophilus]|uniref:Phospholysine phosphohistidine inorganic pyrophosphate phosphatase n=1 Tax=Bursaphelenchus xylophilus TaxID=6326 RepID=A0A1I7RZK3_BURXY|nr:unnamed protein product [Bursaphelenchus xylophilus]CAG9111331.1 unnamed protein product [Bursaphelenchus xylophilus]
MAFKPHSVKGFLLDITGVLYNSSPEGGEAIKGSIEAIARLYRESTLRFVSNESTSTPAKLHAKLTRLGFTLKQEHLFTPAPVAADYIKRNGLRPHLLIHKGVLECFSDCDTTNPNCVVVGDAEDDFTYENMNKAFRVLMESERPLLISLGCGRFYQRVTGPCMDLGGFAIALKYATGCEHIVLGKPDESYFMAAINDMGLSKEEVVMVGDDIVSDIGGAQSHGIRAIQVKTGKWRPEWEKHYVNPDFIADNLQHAVETVLDAK